MIMPLKIKIQVQKYEYFQIYLMNLVNVVYSLIFYQTYNNLVFYHF